MKRKVKKFSAGGDYASSDDAKNLISAAEREAVEYEGEKIAKPLREAAQLAKYAASSQKVASFGEAFKEAKERGDKTFEYMGKKYTTETAKPKAQTKTAGPRVTDTGDETLRLSSRRPSPMSGMKTVSSKARLGMADLSGYKQGGKVSSASKRADGCAQRGKTKGRFV